jgi:hypothetical protein
MFVVGLTRIRLHSRRPPPPESPHCSQRKPTVTQLGSLHRPRNHGQPTSSTVDRPRCQIDAAYSAAYVGYRGVSRFGADEQTVIEIWPRHRSTVRGKSARNRRFCDTPANAAGCLEATSGAEAGLRRGFKNWHDPAVSRGRRSLTAEGRDHYVPSAFGFHPPLSCSRPYISCRRW